jgi:hypothetical protein
LCVWANAIVSHGADPGDPDERFVAIAIARREAAGRQKRSRDASSGTLEIGRRRSWPSAPTFVHDRVVANAIVSCPHGGAVNVMVQPRAGRARAPLATGL